MSSIINKGWKLTKLVLPQHTDHARVMWHGSYINFLEEARIDALNKVGMSYSELSEKGFEIPVVSLNIKYKMSFNHGDKALLISQFKMDNKIRLNCKTFFVKVNGDIAAEALVGLVVVRKKNDSIKLIRELPDQIKNILLLLEEGPKIEMIE
ncbi:acyl-CoA thioesterase [Prochlorococcus marinus]|uniref:Acyl-CoA thioesterase n=1 Tax=Prochlorococcus marinus XMU1408 TaxID=2213228 RepID=A0A318R8Y1_PROMR|nr:acyl-CoA thioesterase [Prochlorococcus marinus]MBW3041385.1 acyl-CoA thioesterase [Prochlorococcus marinus str. XMU1408]PYE02549.1 acyl-CoA thioesterase [Prochlorococcus marinus XMU1408]